MITKHYFNEGKTALVVSKNSSQFEIQVGKLANLDSFLMSHTILIEENKPNLLWDLLHEAMGIPYPTLEPLKKTLSEKKENSGACVTKNSLEQELQKLSAREIVEKVKNEKGVTITNCLKSKKTIIAKALKIYHQHTNKS